MHAVVLSRFAPVLTMERNQCHETAHLAPAAHLVQVERQSLRALHVRRDPAAPQRAPHVVVRLLLALADGLRLRVASPLPRPRLPVAKLPSRSVAGCVIAAHELLEIRACSR